LVTDHKRNDMAVSFLAVFLPNIFQTGIPEWVSMPFSREISTQGSNLGLLHCRQILYCLSHLGSSLGEASKQSQTKKKKKERNLRKASSFRQRMERHRVLRQKNENNNQPIIANTIEKKKSVALTLTWSSKTEWGD